MTKGREVPPRIDWLNRLAKWRSVLTGRVLGTRPITDPQTQGYRDLFEKLLLLRAEQSAVASLLAKKGLITAEEFTRQVQYEAKVLCEQYEASFPGFTATDIGMDIDVAKAAQTTKGWPE